MDGEGNLPEILYPPPHLSPCIKGGQARALVGRMIVWSQLKRVLSIWLYNTMQLPTTKPCQRKCLELKQNDVRWRYKRLIREQSVHWNAAEGGKCCQLLLLEMTEELTYKMKNTYQITMLKIPFQILGNNEGLLLLDQPRYAFLVNLLTQQHSDMKENSGGGSTFTQQKTMKEEHQDPINHFHNKCSKAETTRAEGLG